MTGTRSRRLTGVDIARLVAVAGMVMVHFGPSPVPETLTGDIYDLSHGRASILFALLAGVGVALLFRRMGSGGVWSAVQIVVRAALLLPLGLWLQTLDHGVLVILQYYAVYFLFALLVVGLPDRVVLACLAGVLVFGPLIYLEAESARPAWFQDDPSAMGDSPGKMSRDLLLSGSYPLVTWAAPILAGVWVGRRDLSSSRIQCALLVGGAGLVIAATAAAWLSRFASDPRTIDLLSTEPHSQMPLWLAGSIGVALAILGGSLLLSHVAGRAAWPFVAAGQLAFTIYVGHLFLLHGFPDLLNRDQVGAASIVVFVFVTIVVLLSWLWRAWFAYGPLEAVFRAPRAAIERIAHSLEMRRRS